MSPPTERRELTVTGEPGRRTTPEDGERIDRFLGRQFDDLSRSRIEQLIAQERVTVDGEVPKPSRKARPGQRVVLEVPPPVEPSAEPQAIPLDIVFEDEHLVVVDKAVGMVVHPAPGHPDRTLVNALLHHCGDLSGIGGVLRPGIVHRLDKDTSGLLVAAKTQQAHMVLARQLKARDMGRRYLAVVWGHPDPEEGTIRNWIGRSRSDRKRMAAYEPRRPPLEKRWGRPGEEERMRSLMEEDLPPRVADDAMDSDQWAELYGTDDADREETGERQQNPEGVPDDARLAVTCYATERRYDVATLVSCSLQTGRTHQIRVHFAHRGHPLVGDGVYGGDRKVLKGLVARQRGRAQAVLETADRQMLHAGELSFTHPASGEAMRFESTPPADFRALLELLGEEQEP